MFRQVRFECGACGDGFVDWHDDEWERSAVFCVHCGAAILQRGSFAPPPVSEQRPSESQPARSLGVLKVEGEGFRDTLPGLLAAPADPERSHELEAANRDTEPTLPRASRPRGLSEATSTAPKARASEASGQSGRKRAWAPFAALLLGFATGVPAALFAENPLLRALSPAAHRELELNEQLALVSQAIDAGSWDRARELLDRVPRALPGGDTRVATLQARLTLGLILANRPRDAGRELSAVPPSGSLHPSASDLRRVYDALFPSRSSAAKTSASSTPAAPSAEPSRPKVVVTKRELLSFARDRQHRAKLDEAERLYGEVLRTHPHDAEAHCGLAEVQLLRGGAHDAAELFEHALNDDPGYAPAWVGLADIDWLGGHPERAACRYRAVIERFATGSYPPYIAQRFAQVTHSGVNPPQARSAVAAAHACDD